MPRVLVGTAEGRFAVTERGEHAAGSAGHRVGPPAIEPGGACLGVVDGCEVRRRPLPRRDGPRAVASDRPGTAPFAGPRHLGAIGGNPFSYEKSSTAGTDDVAYFVGPDIRRPSAGPDNTPIARVASEQAGTSIDQSVRNKISRFCVTQRLISRFA